jgi:hypothetical protein
MKKKHYKNATWPLGLSPPSLLEEVSGKMRNRFKNQKKWIKFFKNRLSGEFRARSYPLNLRHFQKGIWLAIQQ